MLSGRIIAGTGSSLARTKTTRKAAIRAIPLLACLLTSCSPAGSSTQQVILEPTEPAVTETFEEPTETSTREPIATPTSTQEPTPTPTEIPMYDGPLVEAERYVLRGDPTTIEHRNDMAFDWYLLRIGEGWLTLVSASPNILEPGILMNQVWGFNLGGTDYRFRINATMCNIYSEDDNQGMVTGDGMYGLIEGEDYNISFVGLYDEIPEKYYQAINPYSGRPILTNSCNEVLRNMQTGEGNLERVSRFLRSGNIEGLMADERGIYDLRGMITLSGTAGEKNPY